ncbi:MAG: hypothetical protein U0R64_02205 [Candidatus Nanopelagicales bacterium]
MSNAFADSRRIHATVVGVVGLGAALTLAACAPTSNSVSAPTSASPSAGSTIAHVVTKDGTGSFISPVLQSGRIFIAQSKSGGSITSWQLTDLPKAGSASPVTVAPTDSSIPDMSSNAKMEQIAFTPNNSSLYITKKAINGSQGGANSVWKYDWNSNATKGSGTNLAGLDQPGGDGSQAWPGNNAKAAIDYTYAAGHFPKPDGSTTPTKVAIGNGGGVAQAGNGFVYFGSLQSGCVYKQDPKSSQTWAVYCIPSWGAENQNQSIYSLDTDKAGNVYAIYQGATDNNTIILKITPGGAGQTSDKIQAIQLKGWARSIGLAVTADGNRIFADGTSMAQYDQANTNSLLQVDKPTWGTPEAPTQVTPTATQIPAIGSTPWLTGIGLLDKGGSKGDRVYIADNTNGFWIVYL